MRHTWTQEDFDRTINILRRCVTVDQACACEGVPGTPDSLNAAFKRKGLKPPSTYLLQAESPVYPNVTTDRYKDCGLDIAALLPAIKSRPTLEQLCDKFDVAPSTIRKLLAQAKADGYAIELGSEHLRFGHAPTHEEHEVDIPQTEGGRFKLGVLSDLHAGSKYAMRKQLKDCVHRMYRAGARDILIVGDLLDGCYKHGVFELSSSGVHDQTADLERSLPRFDGLRYHAITGNHDFTFSEHTGLDVGRYIEGYFRDNGRDDMTFYGDRAATLRIGGTTVRLLHPSGSCSYAISYKLQKFVEAFDSAEKPGILLVGHYHRSCYIYTRGVHTIACPTFQGPGSAFGKSLGLGPQAMGGLMLSWKLTKYKTIRDFTLRPLSYFVKEQEKETFR